MIVRCDERGVNVPQITVNKNQGITVCGQFHQLVVDQLVIQREKNDAFGIGGKSRTDEMRFFLRVAFGYFDGNVQVMFIAKIGNPVQNSACENGLQRRYDKINFLGGGRRVLLCDLIPRCEVAFAVDIADKTLHNQLFVRKAHRPPAGVKFDSKHTFARHFVIGFKRCLFKDFH